MLFCVTTRHTSGHARNRGVMLITGAVTLVTWPVTLISCSYMQKMAVRLLDKTLLEQVGDKAVEMYGPSERVRGIRRSRTVRQRIGQRSSYGFPRVINSLMCGYVRATRNIPQEL